MFGFNVITQLQQKHQDPDLLSSQMTFGVRSWVQGGSKFVSSTSLNQEMGGMTSLAEGFALMPPFAELDLRYNVREMSTQC